MKIKNIVLGRVLSISALNANQIIVYNDNLSLLNENKNVNIEAGNFNIKYENVSNKIFSDSVSIDLPENVFLLEQNFKYDLVNIKNILKRNINNEISFKHYKNNNQEFEIRKGSILGIDENKAIINCKDNNKIVFINLYDIIVTDKQLDGMQTKPSLLFKVNSDKNYTDYNMTMSYLSRGFSWQSNYVATINQEDLIINGWVKLNNNTDVTLKNYDLKLFAGDVNQVSKNDNIHKNEMVFSATIDSMRSKNFEVKEKSLSGYHIYEIPFKVDIEKKSEKQINFLNLKTKNWIKKNEITLNSYFSNTTNQKFSQNIIFNNTKENNLGKPLPKGKIRFYKKDISDNTTYFIGENNLNNIAKNEEVKIKIGTNFDIFLNASIIEKEINKIKKSSHTNGHIIYKYEITNSSNKPEFITITQKNIFSNVQKKDIFLEIIGENKEKINLDFEDINDININFILNPNEKMEFKLKNKVRTWY